MKISRSTGYALLAVGYIAKNDKDGLVTSQVIAKEYDIPLEYLLKILQQLVRANILRSKRGPTGGFCMARPATRISMLHIIEAVDGPMTSHLDLTGQAKGLRFASRTEKTFSKAISQVKSTFAKTKLSNLLGGK